MTSKKCATCMQNSDEQKAKPSITSCEGCHQAFCLSHFVEHRQTLNKTLDDIAGQRDVLRSRIEELSTRMPKEDFQTIHDWKNRMLQMVNEAAKDAQEKLQQLLITEMERECSELTRQITTYRNNEDYFEIDMEKLQSQIGKLNEELNDLPNLHRIELHLPTLNCSDMVHIKSIETHSLPQVTERNDSTMILPKEQYRSFIECFLTTQQPLIDLQTRISGYACASPTMLIDITHYHVERLVFYRESTSRFDWKRGEVLAVRWSPWLQQFIILTNDNVVAVDAVEKQSEVVVEEKHNQFKHMSNWKHLCLIADSANCVFLYKMNRNMTDWLLLYCWTTPATSGRYETMTAIGLNEHHIILSIKVKYYYQHYFSIRKHDMTIHLDIQLSHPCTLIQALPHHAWLLYDSSTARYEVIDSKLVHHDEPYLSSLTDFQLDITCEETEKILVVLLPKEMTTSTRKPGRIRVYTNSTFL